MRLQVLEDAGRHAIPFTTGLLVGIGETLRDRAETVFAIRAAHRRHGHVQEVIVQNFRAKADTAMRARPDAGPRGVPRRDRRDPPGAGPADAGAGPAEPRRPRRDRPAAARRRRRLGRRLPADPRPRQPRAALAAGRRPRGDDRASGLRAARAADRAPAATSTSRGSTPGCPATSRRSPVPTAWPRTCSRSACRGRSPTAGWCQSGRTDLHATVDTTGRTDDRRSDFDDVYGDWSAVREQVQVPAQGARLDHDVAAALRVARDRPAALTTEQALALHHRRRRRPRGGLRAGRRRAAGHRRRRGHLRREPEHQLHQRLLHRLPLLRVRAAAHRRRRLHPVARRGRRPGPRGVGRRRDRGLHAGRHRPAAARHRVPRPGPRREGGRARAAPARVQPDGGRQRRSPHVGLDRGVPARRPRGRCRQPAGDGRGDPGRRRPLGADQGQAADRAVGRGRHDRAPARASRRRAR